jgi:hypothetical protein
MDDSYGGILPPELRCERDRLINGFCNVIDAERGHSAAPMMAAIVTLAGRWLADVASCSGNDLKLEFLLETFTAGCKSVAEEEYPAILAARSKSPMVIAKRTKRTKRHGADPEPG